MTPPVMKHNVFISLDKTRECDLPLKSFKEAQILKFHYGITSRLLYVLFWAIPQRLHFICRRFGTLCLFHLHRQVGSHSSYLPAYEDGTGRVF